MEIVKATSAAEFLSIVPAGAMLERALDLDPGYRMANILLTWFDSVALPEWRFRRLE